jgi:transposase
MRAMSVVVREVLAEYGEQVDHAAQHAPSRRSHGGQTRTSAPVTGFRTGTRTRSQSERYEQRNNIERLMNRRKQFRAVATRYDCACRYRATVQIPDIVIWLRAKPDRSTATRIGHTINR